MVTIVTSAAVTAAVWAMAELSGLASSTSHGKIGSLGYLAITAMVVLGVVYSGLAAFKVPDVVAIFDAVQRLLGRFVPALAPKTPPPADDLASLTLQFPRSGERRRSPVLWSGYRSCAGSTGHLELAIVCGAFGWCDRDARCVCRQPDGSATRHEIPQEERIRARGETSAPGTDGARDVGGGCRHASPPPSRFLIDRFLIRYHRSRSVHRESGPMTPHQDRRHHRATDARGN